MNKTNNLPVIEGLAKSDQEQQCFIFLLRGERGWRELLPDRLAIQLADSCGWCL